MDQSIIPSEPKNREEAYMNIADPVASSEAVKSEKRKLYLEISAYLSPIIIIVTVFVFAPLLIIFFFSFLKSSSITERIAPMCLTPKFLYCELLFAN